MSENNNISISNNVKVNGYDIVDDLELTDETVTVQIVDAMFTSTIPDWLVDDPTSPYYIKNKPTKTSDFVNDGEGGTSRFVTFNNLTEYTKVEDVQIKTSGTYKSVLVDKIAKIDLSNYITKELKTGSTTLYKVLSDNNYSDEEKQKVNAIRINGNGENALVDNGSYRPLYNILSVNNIRPDVNKNIQITAENINYGEENISSVLDRVVCYKSKENRQIVLENSNKLLGKTTSGDEINLINISNNDIVTVGSGTAGINIYSITRPTIISNNVFEDMAYLSDIVAHNNSLDAHEDIRNSIKDVSGKALFRITNDEMESAIYSGNIEEGKLVVPIDFGNYIEGKVYQFVKGNPNSWKLISNWQIENLYKSSDPSSSTEGLIGQLYVNVNNRRTFYCADVQNNVYTWVDITPELPDIANQVESIIKNTTLISDSNGGFTAGNSYRLLDSSGKIPIERLPSAVIGGITYGGAFDENGIITASSYTPEINGQNISTIDKKFYTNYYFYSKGSYVLDGDQYYKGDFALSTGEEWAKLDNQGGVISVNGQVGDVVLTYSDVNAMPDTIKYASSLQISGTQLTLLDQDNNVLSTVTTQDTTYGLANSTTDGLMSSTNYNKLQEIDNNMPTVIEF